MRFRDTAVFLLAMTLVFMGWRISGLKSSVEPGVPEMKVAAAPAKKVVVLPHARARERDEFKDGTTVELFASREPNQVILRFPSDEAYESFFFAMVGSGIQLVDQLDRLRAMRLSYDQWEDFSNLLAGENITAYDSLPVAPSPAPTGEALQEGVVGFGKRLLPWLGVTESHPAWGHGVKVAVLDNGVMPHRDLPGLSQSIEITPYPENLEESDGHGTAVASLIAGRNPEAPGIAPAAEIISIRVGDNSGRADSFALAAGILAAIDAGAHLINISMGTSENNPLIEEAVLLAHQKNVLIVAASGNSARGSAAYPAAYPTVVSVGAVDARGEHLEFSNYGDYLSLTAPGYAVQAAWPGDRQAKISGTSASAPIVTGAIAATMSSGNGVVLDAAAAARIVMDHANDAGIPGPDSQYGFGILNLGRVMNRNVPGIVDVAITHQRLVRLGQGSSGEIQITLQNRGTTQLINTLLEVTTSFGTRQFNATSLAPGEIKTFSMPVRLSGLSRHDPLQVVSEIISVMQATDATPYNNIREDTLYLH